MTEHRNKQIRENGRVIHLPKPRKEKLVSEQLAELGATMSAHFREQNELFRQSNAELKDQVKRLLTGIDTLMSEVNGVRTGKKEEAFARIGAAGEGVDLPTVSGEAALFYTQTAGDIAEALGGFNASQIGLLLSARGLGWVGNGDYQEIGRNKKPHQTKFWHRDVPDRLRKILDAGKPEQYGIKQKSVLTIFRKWQERCTAEEMLHAITTDSTAH